MSTALDDLRRKLGCDWPSIARAEAKTNETRAKVTEILTRGGAASVCDDASVVVFGSLARDEWTSGSDVDWTLLVDGRADPEHRKIAQFVEDRLRESELKEPERTGLFGSMAFSHDIIHQIGGERDTNKNTTRRVLLLLESYAVLEQKTHDRVLRAILNRYLEDDGSFATSGSRKYLVPRFLLNDIVRYWRTMAVDYVHKVYERAGRGWALRNVKLRMSRKLIFVSGLLTCFSCFLDPSPGLAEASAEDPQARVPRYVNHLIEYVKKTPVTILAEALAMYAEEDTARGILSSYDEFLSMVDDRSTRERLGTLSMEGADKDKVFLQAKDVSHRFQEGLTRFFFDENAQVRELTRKYGVF